VTPPVVWLPEADAELKEALAHYESVRPALAQRFAEAVVDTVQRIAEGPLNYAVVEKERRRAGVHRFPWAVLPRRREADCCNGLYHGRRNPKHWQLR
jgi:plasmid stabilization system protein ParE